MRALPVLAFVVTEDWFFVSHFLPMLRAARKAGFEPLVVTRVRNHRASIEAAGARVIELEADRRSLNPFAIAATVFRLARILREEKAIRVHLIALRSILIGGFAAMLAGVRHRVFAVTGRGFIAARTDVIGRLSTRLVVLVIRGILQTRKTQFLFENGDDPQSFGLRQDGPEVTIVGGAGIDPEHYTPVTISPTPPMRVAVVSRMLWSKGIDLAVEAVTIARSQGMAVELSLYGAPDPSNPKAIPLDALRQWATRDGIAWKGVAADVREVWASHHVACLPSRGGEGLPRTLLEAAACGRALLTTDVPGCRSFVRDGQDGFVVPPDNAQALADRLVWLSANPEATACFGRSARERVEDGFTETAVIDQVARMYRT